MTYNSQPDKVRWIHKNNKPVDINYNPSSMKNCTTVPKCHNKFKDAKGNTRISNIENMPAQSPHMRMQYHSSFSSPENWLLLAPSIQHLLPEHIIPQKILEVAHSNVWHSGIDVGEARQIQIQMIEICLTPRNNNSAGKTWP